MPRWNMVKLLSRKSWSIKLNDKSDDTFPIGGEDSPPLGVITRAINNQTQIFMMQCIENWIFTEYQWTYHLCVK